MPTSLETEGIILYQRNTGVAARVTSIDTGVHSFGSYHYKDGTPAPQLSLDGRGLAVDMAAPQRWDANGLKAIFKSFQPVEHLLTELICSWMPYSIKNGVRVGRYAVSSHWDHVHTAVGKGTFLYKIELPHIPIPGADMPANRPPVALVVDPQGRGYWQITDDGGVFTFPYPGQNLPFHGSLGGHQLNARIIDAEASATGEGYWMAGEDGGVFCFGDADFKGSLGGTVEAPTVAITRTPTGQGYWLTLADGKLMPFGDAVEAGHVDYVPH